MREASRYALGLRRTAQVIRAERTVYRAALKALTALGETASRQLEAASYDTSVLDSRHPAWQAAVDEHLLPAIGSVFAAAYDAGTTALTAAASPSEAVPELRAASDLAAEQYLTTQARNRLVDVSDTVYGQIVAAINEGRNTGAGESIPQLAARVNALLSDTERWRNRATVIARTEGGAANGAGYHTAASDTAGILGHTPSEVAKEWLATSDARTRPTHAEANHQTVVGMGTPFIVGGTSLAYACDPAGEAGEVIQCRCTTLYHYPGDADYPLGLAASGSHYRADPGSLHTVTPGGTMTEMAPTPDEQAEAAASVTVVVVALPAADDPAQGIGEEQKHASVLYLGDLPDSAGDTPNPGLTPDFLAELMQLVSDTAAATPAFTADVTGVESLGNDGARVWMLGGDTMSGLRDSLTTGSVPDVLGQVEQFPTYTPHVTIGYPADAPADAEAETDDDAPDADDAGMPSDTTMLDDATETAAAAVTSIRFDRLACWVAGEQTEYPLASAVAAPAAPPSPAALQEALAVLSTMLQTHAVNAYAPIPTPGEAPAGGPALAQDIPADGEPFYGIACPEDVMSGDARMFESSVVTWRDLPLPLMYQDATMPGHDGAVRVGRLDVLERDDTTYSKPMIRYSGVWDTSDIAVEAKRQVEAKVARGVSVDCDQVTVELQDSGGQPLDPMVDDFPADGVVVEVASAARICGLTICSVPAFAQAYIANGTYDAATAVEPGMDVLDGPAPQSADDTVADERPALAASAWSLVAAAGPMPVWPHADFCNPGLTETTRLTVTDDGRVYGHLATWGVCHIGIDGICQEPPVSAADYAYFTTGHVETDEGLVPVGQLTMETGHANMGYGARAAAAHYDNTGSCVADVAMGQDGVGIWFAGRLRPGTTPEQVYALRASGSVSGDWREIGTGLELVAALVVNTPGFPIPVAAVAASGQRAVALVASGIVRPEETARFRDAGSPLAIRRAVVADVVATLDRRSRIEAATRRLRAQRAGTATRRLTESRRRRVAAAAARINRKG